MKKFILSIILILSLLLSLFGCNDTPENTDFSDTEPTEEITEAPTESETGTDADVTNHSIIKKDGKTYIVFDDITKYEMWGYTGIDCTSLDEWNELIKSEPRFYSQIPTLIRQGILEKIEFENGKTGVELYDLDNAYTPFHTLDKFNKDGIFWYFGGYATTGTYNLTNPEEKLLISVFMGTESFLKCYEDKYTRSSSYSHTATKKETSGEYEIDVKYYESNDKSAYKAEYSFQSGTKRFEVTSYPSHIPNNDLETIWDLSTGTVIVNCYIEHEGETIHSTMYFTPLRTLESGLYIPSSTSNITPTPEWLLSWDVEKYVPQ